MTGVWGCIFVFEDLQSGMWGVLVPPTKSCLPGGALKACSIGEKFQVQL